MEGGGSPPGRLSGPIRVVGSITSSRMLDKWTSSAVRSNHGVRRRMSVASRTPQHVGRLPGFAVESAPVPASAIARQPPPDTQPSPNHCRPGLRADSGAERWRRQSTIPGSLATVAEPSCRWDPRCLRGRSRLGTAGSAWVRWRRDARQRHGAGGFEGRLTADAGWSVS
jgi:hypothetical protein